MLMNDLTETELFVLINKSSQKITNEEMQCAYGKFIEHIDIINQVEGNLINAIKKLNLSRIEFISLQLHPQYEQGKKCP